MAQFPRRKFLKTIGGAAVASAFADVNLGAQRPPPYICVFWEERFPVVDGCGIKRNDIDVWIGDVASRLLNEHDLIEQLNAFRFDLLITPFGSTFPKRAWPEILKFLRRGGNWLNIGGVPLSRPVMRCGTGREWCLEPHQTTFHKQLGITHSFPVKAGAISSYEAPAGLNNMFKPELIHELYVRLSSSKNEPDEDGSDGPREGVVRPLVVGLSRDRRPVAAPVIQIDRMEAEFAGGRWIFANFNGSLDPQVLLALAQRAAEGASHFEVQTDAASYKPGDNAAILVQLERPKGKLEDLANSEFRIEMRNDADAIVWQSTSRLRAEKANAFTTFNPDTSKLPPGFYKLSAQITLKSAVESPPYALTHSTGFWIYDIERVRKGGLPPQEERRQTPSPDLLLRGKPLTVDNHFFRRDGKVFPVTGTTYMASDVHRQFLFDPNPHVWDKDFSAMKDAGVNMIRTGIWTGWKKYMTPDGKVNETVLRAFDAFLLTAHKYDIPVIFTFFAFLPETWGGENAYLDPRSIKAQQQFISAFTHRYARVDDVIWDFINEPSFGSYKYIWSCRPNYDAHERAAWQQWLRDRYPAPNEEEFLAQLQQAWRTNSDDLLELPAIKDFESVNLIDERRPLKTLDYRLFAQEMFIRWLRQMTAAVRSNGNSKQLITVGQDENGLGDSPNPQFFAREIDFTSMHNWWNNDDLVWDSVLSKTPWKMNLMEETGVMFYERSDGGAAWRSEEEVSRLLERKMALSFAADGAGFIEWVWNTNPYMNSTNEVGIGFHRVDGTAKPELEPFLKIAKFMREHGQRLQQRASEPVAMLIPHSQMFAPRSFAHEATRKCVRAMYYHCGVPMQAVSEHTLKDYTDKPKLIIVPSPRVLTQQCWEILVARAQQGATVAITGSFFADEHWRPASRLPAVFRGPRSVPVAESETVTIGRRDYLVRYDGDKMQRVEKIAFEEETSEKVIIFPKSSGWIVWCTLPLELGDSMPALAAFYRAALRYARVTPLFTATPRTPAVLILPSIFRDVVLYTFISESDRDTRLTVTHLENKRRFNVLVPAGRTAMVLIDR